MSHTKFAVQITLPVDQHVRVVGNIPELGQWSPFRSAELKCCRPADGDDGIGTWSIILQASDVDEFEYRYMICMKLEDGSQENFVIIKVGPLQKHDVSGLVDDGLLNINGPDWVDGWLLDETEIHLTVHNADSFPISLCPRQCLNNINQDSLQIKVSKLKNGQDSLSEDDPCSVITKVVGECYCSVEKQNKTGICYNPARHYSFVSQVLRLDDVCFKIDLYSSNAGSSHIGSGYILPSTSLSCGIIDVVISKNQSLVGSVQVEYLIIKPLHEKSLHNMESWPDRNWQCESRTLLMGHRGCGATFSSTQGGVQENTIESFIMSKERGDDGVELDVHLTKDLQPVIYHDLDMKASLITKDGGKLKRSFQVHELTYKELQEIKMELTSADELNSEINSRTEAERKIAPTLQEVFAALPEDFPMELEVKYLETEKGQKDDSFLDVNVYIDVILKAVLENIGKRKIILMSFSPVIVQLMQRKQRNIPVKIAVCGDTPKYPVYRDIRIRTLGRIMGFAECEGILGISTFCECILEDTNLVKEVKKRGLILSTWGDLNNFENIREKQRKMGVNVLCYDKLAT